MRLPSVVEDMTETEWLRSVSLPDEEGPEKLVTADEYLRPQDLMGGFHPLDSRYLVKMSSVSFFYSAAINSDFDKASIFTKTLPSEPVASNELTMSLLEMLPNCES